MVSQREIEDRLCLLIADAVGLDPEMIDRDARFDAYGVPSIEAVNLIGDLEDYLSVDIPPEAAFDYPSVRGLAQFLVVLSDE